MYLFSKVVIVLGSIALFATTFIPSTFAQPTVDGDLTGDVSFYGAALSVQNTNSGYGNTTNGDQRWAAGGSEIDQVFGRVVGDRLYILIAGNLESNYNKMGVFFDSEPGGMNQINGNNAPASVDPFCCPDAPAGAGALQQLNGLRFDTGFEADHFIGFSNGPETVTATQLETYSFSAYYGDLTAGSGGLKSDVGFERFARGVEPGLEQGEPIDEANNACSGPGDTGCSPGEHLFAEQRNFLNTIGLRMAIDNSNTQGVNAGSGSATGNPQSVTTGIEFSIPLSVLGNPTDDIRIAAFIGNSQYSHISNQVVGDGILQGNLGSNIAGLNFASITGDQFVTIPNGYPGDFNADGTVNAADYTVWRDGLGTVYAPADYDVWASHFGESNAGIAVPEPQSVALVMLALSPRLFRRKEKTTNER